MTQVGKFESNMNRTREFEGSPQPDASLPVTIVSWKLAIWLRPFLKDTRLGLRSRRTTCP